MYTVIGLFYKTTINAEEKSRLACAEASDSRPYIYPQLSVILTLPYKLIVYSSVLKYGISPLVRAPIFNTTYLQNKPIDI